MKKIKKILTKENILFLVYVISTFLISMHHENWFDEGQAWQIVKYNSLTSLFSALKYEGHPCLWYILIMPFAKLGFPYRTINVICLVSMWCASFLLIKNSKFRFITKIAILATVPYIYVYPSIARSYSLVPLFCSILAICRGNKKYAFIYSITLALFANLHVYTLVISIVFVLEFFVKEILMQNDIQLKRKNRIYFFIMLFGIIFSILTLYGSIEKCNIVYRTKYTKAEVWQKVKDYIIGCLVTFTQNRNILSVILAVVFIVMCVILINYDKFGMTVMLSFIAISIYAYIFLVYWIQIEKISMYIVVIVCLLWNLKDKYYESNEKIILKKNGIIIDLIIIIISICTLKYGYGKLTSDIKLKYCVSEEIAEFIKENIDNQSIIISGMLDASVQAYLGENEYNFVRWNTWKQGRYSVWTKEEQDYGDVEKVIEKCYEYSTSGKKVYLLVSVDPFIDIEKKIFNQIQEIKNFDLIYINGISMEYKQYFIFEFNN